MSGTFLCLEGIDGSGKTTQVALLETALREEGHDVVRCREPGGTAVGEEIRRLLLDSRAERAMLTEVLLYMASRAQLVVEVIRPALGAGKVVLADRFLLASVVYQGHAGRLDPDVVRQLGEIATAGVLPAWVGILDLAPEAAALRRSGPKDVIEERGLAFQQRVRAGYLAEAQRDPGHYHVFDATRAPDAVHHEILTEVRRVLGR